MMAKENINSPYFPWVSQLITLLPYGQQPPSALSSLQVHVFLTQHEPDHNAKRTNTSQRGTASEDRWDSCRDNYEKHVSGQSAATASTKLWYTK